MEEPGHLFYKSSLEWKWGRNGRLVIPLFGGIIMALYIFSEALFVYSHWLTEINHGSEVWMRSVDVKVCALAEGQTD